MAKPASHNTDSKKLMKDTENGYGEASILLHWVAAIAIIALFVLGQAAEDATDSDRKAPARLAYLYRHLNVSDTCRDV